VVDQAAAAVKQVETLVALAPRKATAGTFRRPDPKLTVGLPDALGRHIEHRDRSGRNV
jgi:allantoin racemase